MKRNHFLLLMCLCMPCLSGCGNSQDDMRKYALSDPNDEEDEEDLVAGSVPPIVTATTANNSTVASSPNALPPVTTSGSVPQVSTISNSQSAPSFSVSANSTVSPMAAMSPSGPLSDTVARGTLLSPRDRREHAIQSMKKIAAAMVKYQSEKGVFPAQVLGSVDGRPLLSWRVELLPYLGYQDLYAAFHRDEAWDSPHNQSLLARIPSVFQSPERFDESTNFLVPVGSSSAFSGTQGKSPRRWEDGVANCLLLLEVNDDRAVPWSAPADLIFESTSPLQGLGQLREDGFFASWADGNVVLLPHNLPAETARAMYTVDGGESFVATSVSRPALADSPRKAGSESIISRSIASQDSHNSIGPSERVNPEFSTASNTLHSSSFSDPTVSTIATSAQQAFRSGAVNEAMALAMATYLCEPANSESFPYQWLPGLKRPAIALRFGVGIVYTGIRSEELTKQLSPVVGNSGAGVTPYESLLGDLGTTVFDQIRSVAPFLPSLLSPMSIDDHRNLPAGNLQSLGVGSAGELRRVAQRYFVDVLLLFDVEERRGSRGGAEATIVGLSVNDAWTGQSLLKCSPINYLKREREKTNPLFVDPVEEFARTFDDLLAKRLRPQPIPAELRASHSVKRVGQLTKIHRDNPLPLLCEIKFYRDANLLTAAQVLEAFQTLAGPAAGTALAAGTPAERKEALRAWIPRPQSYAAAIRGSTSSDDD